MHDITIIFHKKITCSIISQNPLLGTLPSFSMSSLFALYCLCLLYTVYVCFIPSLFVLYRIFLLYTFFVCFLPSLFALYRLCLLCTVFVYFILSLFASYRLFLLYTSFIPFPVLLLYLNLLFFELSFRNRQFKIIVPCLVTY